MTELWNIRAGKDEFNTQNDVTQLNMQYGTMQKWMNDRANDGYTRFTVWKE